MNHAKDILAGLAVFIIVAGLVLGGIFLAYSTGQNNNEKVQHMTELCVKQGYTGWSGGAGCFGGQPRH